MSSDWSLSGKVLPHISRSKYILSSKCGRFHSDDILEWFDFSYDKVYRVRVFLNWG